jgi:hypothetical protein
MYSRAWKSFGGARRNRTADMGFADPCLTTWRPRHPLCSCSSHRDGKNRPRRPSLPSFVIFGRKNEKTHLPGALAVGWHFYQAKLERLAVQPPTPEDTPIQQMQAQHAVKVFCVLLNMLTS